MKAGYEYFQNRINLKEDPFPADLHFFSKFALAWVFKWTLKYGSSGYKNRTLILQMIPSVQWWQNFVNINNVSIPILEVWFNKNPQFLRMADHESSVFFNKRTKIQACLASTSNKEDLVKQLSNILQFLQAESQEGQTSPSSQGFTNILVDYAQSPEEACNLEDDE